MPIGPNPDEEQSTIELTYIETNGKTAQVTFQGNLVGIASEVKIKVPVALSDYASDVSLAQIRYSARERLLRELQEWGNQLQMGMSRPSMVD